MKDKDTNYESDYNQMESIGILNYSNTNNSYNKYWLASRYNYNYKRDGSTYYDSTYFQIRAVNSSGNLTTSNMLIFYEDSANPQINVITSGLRPVIRLKTETKIISGTGTKEDPYILGI